MGVPAHICAVGLYCKAPRARLRHARAALATAPQRRPKGSLSLTQNYLCNCFTHVCDKLIQRPNIITTFFWICLYIRFWNNQPNFFGLHFI
ncbi:hypothetical protein SAMN05720472_1388 [Fibrobacter sp. UWR3]|nr:hypothetical protein SAMN05720472_1388 [Fibrobacter sp. UWR3]